MIARRLGLEQFVAARLALGIKLANALLFLVREPRGHRPGRDQDLRQMAKAQRADKQARNDLVANAEQQRAFEHRMAERDHRALRDIVAAEQRQVHPRLPLRHPVAHRGHAARDLRRRADFAREEFDLFGVAAIRLMRRQHVVIAGDDADVHRRAGADHRLVIARRRKAVRKISARQIAAVRPRVALTRHQVEIGRTARRAARNDAVGDGGDRGVEVSHNNSKTLSPWGEGCADLRACSLVEAG